MEKERHATIKDNHDGGSTWTKRSFKDNRASEMTDVKRSKETKWVLTKKKSMKMLF